MGVDSEENAEAMRQALLALKKAVGFTQRDIAETLSECTGDHVSIQQLRAGYAIRRPAITAHARVGRW